MSRSLTLVRRSLRPALMYAFLLVSVQVTGGVLAAPSTPSSTTYTRSTSCAGLDFYPLRSDIAYDSTGPERIATTLGDNYFLCRPDLPSGAVVTRVRFTLRDDGSIGSLRNCGLVRGHLSSSSANTAEVMAKVPATSGTPGYVRLSDTSIAHATVDNTRYGYWLQCDIVLPGTEGSSVGIYGSDITYRISSTKG